MEQKIRYMSSDQVLFYDSTRSLQEVKANTSSLFQNDLRHWQWFFLSPATVSSLIGHLFSILEKMLDYCICHFGP